MPGLFLNPGFLSWVFFCPKMVFVACYSAAPFRFPDPVVCTNEKFKDTLVCKILTPSILKFQSSLKVRFLSFFRNLLASCRSFSKLRRIANSLFFLVFLMLRPKISPRRLGVFQVKSTFPAISLTKSTEA